MPSLSRRILAIAAGALLALTTLATVLVVLKVVADITVPGLYVHVLPGLADGQKVSLLWLSTASLFVAVTIARRRRVARETPPARAVDPKASMSAEDGGPIVVAQNLWKVYDTGKLKVEALRGANLRVREGEVVCIMGPSGCGKTTLLNCLSGLDDVTSGSAFIEGREIARMSDNERSDFRALRMGFVFQNYNLMPVLTAAENVELPLLLTGASRAQAKKKARDALRTLGLEGRENHRPAELSGGEQQRVAIARSIVNSPAILWADEPTGNLDTKTALLVMGLLLQVNARTGQTVVMVTHDPDVGRRSHRILRMDSGVVVKEEVGELPPRFAMTGATTSAPGTPGPARLASPARSSKGF